MGTGGNSHGNSIAARNHGSAGPPPRNHRSGVARRRQGRGDRGPAGRGPTAVRFGPGVPGNAAARAPRLRDLGGVRTAPAGGKRLVGSLTVPSAGLVYLDANSVIYSVEKHPVYWPLL